MKKISLLTASVLMVGSLALAADHENTQSVTESTSENPLTGTKTTTKTTKKKLKGAHGKAAMKKTETVKEKTDGSKETSVNVESESAEPKQ